MKKILVIFVIFAIMIGISTVYAGTTYMDAMYVDATVKENGDMDVVEKIVFNIEGSTNGVYRSFVVDNKASKNNLNNPSDIKINKVKINDEEYKYSEYTAQNGDKGVYNIIEEYDSGFMVKVFTPSYDEIKTLTLEYTMKDVVVKYSDVAEMYINFIGSDMTDRIEDVKINVKLDVPSPNLLKIFAHGPLNGESKVMGNNAVSAQISNLESGEAVDLRLLFDPQTTKPTKIVEKNALENIMADEAKLANEANTKRVVSKYTIVISLASIIVVSIYGIVKYKKVKKDLYKDTYTGDYYRELPDDYGPAVMNKLLTVDAANPLSMVGTILDLVRRKYIKCEKIDVGKNIFGVAKNDYKLTLLKSSQEISADESLLENEKTFINTLIFDGEAEITLDEMKKRNMKQSRSATLHRLEWKEKIDNDAKKLGLTNKKSDVKIKTTFANLIVIINLILFPIFLSTTNFETLLVLTMLLTWIWGVIKATMSSLGKKTQKGRDDEIKWKAFKKFLTDFSNLGEYEIESLVLWEHYLVYAAGLGVADKVIKQLDIKFAEQLNDDSYMNGLTIMALCSDADSYNSFNDSFKDSAYSSYSSSDGSGGGFSGGGGGGRRRRRSRGLLKIRRKFMGKIVLLDEETINKIAAGEVVDRPASIVKELVENSIDAGSSHITVEIKNGGISYIRITDDGKGIEKDDVRIAFERHATSKIRRESDILKISSMGFRGEALASIASISKVTLETKTKEEYTGTKYVIEGGVESIMTEIPFNQGTKITIENVFFNVPARYKFLKKDSIEASYIEDIMIKLALSHTNISMKYISNGKQVFQTFGSNDLKAVVLNIFGNTYMSSLLDVEFEYENARLKGVIGLQDIARGTRQNEYTFVNGRYVKNKTMTAAIEKGYEQNINIGKYPFVVLDAVIKPEEVDVNVHPAKLEVKFENENKVFDLVYYAIQDRLRKHNEKISPFYTNRTIEENKSSVENGEKINTDTKVDTKIEVSTELGVAENIEEKIEYVNYEIPVKKEEYNDLSEDKESVMTQAEYYIQNTEISDITADEGAKKLGYKYIGAAFDTYIIIEIDNTLYVIDQHAAHERLIYEEIKNMYYSKNKETQMLMIPTLVELTNSEKICVMENIDMFEKAGYILEDFGSNEIKISGVPNVGYSMDFKEMFVDIIDVIKGSSKTVSEEKEKRFIYTLACKAAVKANMKLKKEEHIALIDKMMKLDKPFTCPHGRPTAFQMTKYEIERKFARK